MLWRYCLTILIPSVQMPSPCFNWVICFLHSEFQVLCLSRMFNLLSGVTGKDYLPFCGFLVTCFSQSYRAFQFFAVCFYVLKQVLYIALTVLDPTREARMTFNYQRPTCFCLYICFVLLSYCFYYYSSVLYLGVWNGSPLSITYFVHGYFGYYRIFFLFL